MEFLPERDIHRNVDLFSSQGQPLPMKATYVLLHTAAVGKAHIESCSGCITRLEKLDANRATIETLEGTRPLLWSPREAGKETVAIQPYAPQDLDVFRSVEGTNSIELQSIGHPPRWDAFFSSQGIYRLTIVVSASRNSSTKRLLINWRGKWNDFGVECDASQAG